MELKKDFSAISVFFFIPKLIEIISNEFNSDVGGVGVAPGEGGGVPGSGPITPRSSRNMSFVQIKRSVSKRLF